MAKGAPAANANPVDNTAEQPAAEKREDETGRRLSNEGNTTAKPETTGTGVVPGEKHLPELTVAKTDAPPETKPETPPPLDPKTLERKAEELHDAINRKNNLRFWDRDDPDKDAIFRIIEPMRKEDRDALSKLYHDKFDKDGKDPNTLRRQLHDHLGGDKGVDWRRAEAVMNRENDQTNDAGALMVAITHALKDKDKGNVEIRQVLETLSSKLITRLDEDFQKAYGMSYKEALQKANLTDATRDALPFLEKGVDKREKTDLIELANKALDRGDPRLFMEALRGDSPVAVAARNDLMNDVNFKNRVAEKFESPVARMVRDNGGDPNQLPWEQRVDRLMFDYMKDGRVSLATITTENASSFLGMLDNKDNIELAARNASEPERTMFTEGRRIALAGGSGDTPEQQKAVEYYNKIHQSFASHCNEREVAMCEDQLIHGRQTIISELGHLHSEGFGPFHWTGGHKMKDLMTHVEGLSADDWKLLKDEKTGKEFRDQIEKSLSYADPGERKRIMDLIDKKTSAASPEDAAKIGRTLSETIEDNKEHSFLWWGTSYDSKNILTKLENINADEARKYKDDPAFRESLDKFVKENLSDEQKLLAERLLAKMGQEGQTPKRDPVDQLLHDKIYGDTNDPILKDAEVAFKADPALRNRLNKPYEQLSDSDKLLKGIIEDAMASAFYTNMGIAPDSSPQQRMEYPEDKLRRYQQQLFGPEGLSLAAKVDLGYPKTELIPEIGKAPQAQRDEVMTRLTPDEQAIVKAVAANNGEFTLADRMRLYAIGDGGNLAEIKAELGKKTKTEIQLLKDEYAKNFGIDVDNSFLKKVKEDKAFGKEVNGFKDLLTPTDSDGRQRFYDNYRTALQSFGTGFSADGSGLTLQRSLDESANQLEQYQRIYQTLPKEKQEALDKYFNDSLEQFKQSKEKLAEIAATVLITAAALALTPFTGGTSLALVAGIAFVAGGVAKVAIAKIAGGDEYDWSKALGQFGSGGFEAALNFVGGKIAGELFKGFNVVGTQLAGSLLRAGVVKFGSAEAEVVAGKAFAELIAAGGKSATPEALAKFVSTIAPKATAAEAETIKQMARQAIAQNYDAVLNRVTRVTLAGVDNAAIGGGAGAASVVVNALIDGRPIDADQVMQSAMIGAGMGAVIGVAVHGAIEGRDIYVRMKRTPQGDVLLPAEVGQPPLKLKDKDGTVREVTSERPVTAGEHFDSGPSVKPQDAASAQSQAFKKNHEIPADRRIEDGFIYRHSNGDPAFTVDRAELKPYVDELRGQLDGKSPRDQARLLAEYVHGKLNPAGSSVEEINQWYANYIQKHAGERLTLADFIREGKGVCSQEATMMKALGDELGLKVELVRGDGVNGSADINHVWAEVEIPNEGRLIYDPRQDVYGGKPEDYPNYRRGSEILPGSGEVRTPTDLQQRDFDFSNPEQWQEFYKLNQEALDRQGGQVAIGEKYRLPGDPPGSQPSWTFNASVREPAGARFRFVNESGSVTPELAGFDVNQAIRDAGQPRVADEYAKLVQRAQALDSSPLPEAQSSKLRELTEERLAEIQRHARAGDKAGLQAAQRELSELNRVLDIVNDPAKVAQLNPDHVDSALRLLDASARNKDLSVPYETILDPTTRPEVAKRYADVAEQYSEVRRPGSPEPGHEHEYDVSNQMMKVLKDQKLRTGPGGTEETWLYMPAEHNSSADGMGIDGVFINPRSGEVIMADLASSQRAVDNKAADGKTWGVMIEDSRYISRNPQVRQANIRQRMETFINEQRPMQTINGNGTRRTWTTSDFADVTGTTANGKPMFPSFRQFRTYNESLAHPAQLNTVQETAALRDFLYNHPDAQTDIRTIEQLKRRYNRTVAEDDALAAARQNPLAAMWEGATKSYNQRLAEFNLANGLEQQVRDAVEIRAGNYNRDGINSQPPYRNGTEYPQDPRQPNREFIEFDLKDPIRVGRNEVQTLRVYADGRVAAPEPGFGDVEVGNIYDFGKRFAGRGAPDLDPQLAARMEEAEKLFGQFKNWGEADRAQLASDMANFGQTTAGREKLYAKYPALRAIGEAATSPGAVAAATTDGRRLSEFARLGMTPTEVQNTALQTQLLDNMRHVSGDQRKALLLTRLDQADPSFKTSSRGNLLKVVSEIMKKEVQPLMTDGVTLSDAIDKVLAKRAKIPDAKIASTVAAVRELRAIKPDATVLDAVPLAELVDSTTRELGAGLPPADVKDFLQTIKNDPSILSDKQRLEEEFGKYAATRAEAALTAGDGAGFEIWVKLTTWANSEAAKK